MTTSKPLKTISAAKNVSARHISMLGNFMSRLPAAYVADAITALCAVLDVPTFPLEQHLKFTLFPVLITRASAQLSPEPRSGSWQCALTSNLLRFGSWKKTGQRFVIGCNTSITNLPRLNVPSLRAPLKIYCTTSLRQPLLQYSETFLTVKRCLND